MLLTILLIELSLNGCAMTDDSTYDTVFQTVAGNALILRVHLPGNGSQAPVMTVAGCSASHAWLDGTMKVTGYRPIQSDQQWRDSRMLLGSAVQEVVQHFQVQPPTIHEITDPGLRSIQPQESNSAPTSSAAAPANHYRKQSDDAPPGYDTFLQTQSAPLSQPAPTVDVPDVPAEFWKLEEMDRDELEHLLKDHIALVSFCKDLPYIKELNEKRMSVLEENITKAEANLEQKEELEALHAEVKELQSKLKEHVEKFQELEKKQNSMCAVPDTRTILSDLYKSKKEAYQQSEELAEEWLDDGATDVKGFCRRFIEARKIHHLQAGKMEVLQHQNDC